MVPFSRSEKGTPVNPVGPNNSDFILGQNTSLRSASCLLRSGRPRADLLHSWLVFTPLATPTRVGRWLPGAGPFSIITCHLSMFCSIRRQTSLGHIPSAPVRCSIWRILWAGLRYCSWISAAATAGTVALLLRRGSSASAAIAIIAVPMIAQRDAAAR